MAKKRNFCYLPAKRLAMDFAICFKGDMGFARTKAICRQAELAGFRYCWFYDTHILWRDPIP
jgi:hypothetical protein